MKKKIDGLDGLEVKVSKLTLKFGGRTVNLSVKQARKLKDALDDLFYQAKSDREFVYWPPAAIVVDVAPRIPLLPWIFKNDHSTTGINVLEWRSTNAI